MSWTIGTDTTLAFSCDAKGCNEEFLHTEPGTLEYDHLAEGVKQAAIEEGWLFIDEDGDECYCPEHAAEIEKESQP